MNHLIHLGNGVFGWVAQTTWQAAVLAVMILLAQGLLRKRLSPGWRYGLWLLLVARLVMPGVPPSAFSIFNLAPPAPKQVLASSLPPATIGSDPYFTVNAFKAAPRTPVLPVAPVAEWPDASHLQTPPGVIVSNAWKIEWPNILFWGWLTGVCFFGARLVWTNARFRSRLHGYLPITDEDAMRLFDDCRATFNITQPVRVIESEEVESPAVYGLYRKWLLLPDGIFERFSTEELRCIFLHELAHIKRGDLGVNWLVALLKVLHWFNPVLWLAWARMRADREVATDALALSHVRQTDHVPYGETILKVLEGLTGARALPGSVGIVESKAQLKERLIAISRPGKTWKWAALAAFVLIAGLGLTRAQTEKVHSSTWTVTGHVLDSETQQPIPSFSVTPVQTNDLNGSALSLQPKVDGRNGSYRLNISNRVAQLLRVDARGYLPESKLLPRDATSVDFVLSKDELTGTVLMPDGQPAAGAVVGLFYDYNQAFKFNGEFGFHGRAVSSKTDRNGYFALEPASAAKWLVAELSNGFASMRVESFGTNRIIKLEPVATPEVRARDFELTRQLIRSAESRAISGKVVDSSGHPAAGAQVALTSADSGIYLTGTPRLFDPESGQVIGKPRLQPWKYCTTDAQGRFSLNVFDAPIFLLVAQDSGFARIGSKEFSTNMTVRLERWGRIEGTLWDDSKVVPNQVIRAGILREDSSVWGWATAFKTNTDEHGRFTFEFVPPGLTSINCSGVSETVLVKPGQTSVAKISGKSPPSIGKLTNAASDQETEEISGKVVDPRGQPVAGVQVALVKSNATVDLGIGKSRLFNPQVPHLFGEPRLASLPWNYCTTDAQGRFYLNDLAGALRLVAASESGFADIATNQFSTNMIITLEPWGRVEGVLRLNNHPAGRQEIWLQRQRYDPSDEGEFACTNVTDAQGRFVFPHVPAGDCVLYRLLTGENAGMTGSPICFEIHAGETTNVAWGGNGRPVVGKCVLDNIKVPPGIHSVTVRIHTPDPVELKNGGHVVTPRDWGQWTAWRKSEAGRKASRDARSFVAFVAADGTFQVDDVTPGAFELSFGIRAPSTYADSPPQRIVVPPLSNPEKCEAFDLGALEATFVERGNF